MLSAVGGSFKDPSGRVYVVGDGAGGRRVLRGLTASAAATVGKLLDAPFFRRLLASGDVVATRFPCPDDRRRDVRQTGGEQAGRLRGLHFGELPRRGGKAVCRRGPVGTEGGESGSSCCWRRRTHRVGHRPGRPGRLLDCRGVGRVLSKTLAALGGAVGRSSSRRDLCLASNHMPTADRDRVWLRRSWGRPACGVPGGRRIAKALTCAGRAGPREQARSQDS